MKIMLPTRPVHTYSIVARDPTTGEMGVAVQSHYFSVGPVVPWAEAGVGVVATQALVKVGYGPEGLTLMREGWTAPHALETLLRADENREVRQVAMVDVRGNVVVHTGSKCIAAAGHATGEGFSVQANLMENDTVWHEMKAAYEAATGPLADRLIAALDAAQAAGGDIRGQQSAAIVIVEGKKPEKVWEGRVLDLRVEDHPHPIQELKRLLRLHRAYRLATQSDDYMAEEKWEEAEQAISEAVTLAPEIVELRFWAALNVLMAGREPEALVRFREVFAAEPIWAELVPRLVSADLLPDNPELLQRILEQNVER